MAPRLTLSIDVEDSATFRTRLANLIIDQGTHIRIYPFNLTNLLYRASMLSVFTKGEDDADTQSQDLKPV